MNARLSLAGLALALSASSAFARANDRVTMRVDLLNGAVTVATLPPPSVAPPAPSPPQPHATLKSGALEVTDAAGVKHAVTTIDPRSWLTWQVYAGRTLMIAVRTFDARKPKDDGVDVIDAFDDTGAMRWTRSTGSWVPAAYATGGVVAIASMNDLQLVDPASGNLRCRTPTHGWPAGFVQLDPSAGLFVTTAESRAFDVTTCAVRWTAPYAGGERAPVLYRGKLYESSPAHTATGWSVSVVERDAASGTLARTFAIAAKPGFYDRAGATIVPSGDSLYVEASFIVLD